VIADVKLGVQLEEVQAPVQRVRVEHVPPHWTAPPVETYVPRLVDHRLVPCVPSGQHLFVEQTLRAAEMFLKAKTNRRKLIRCDLESDDIVSRICDILCVIYLYSSIRRGVQITAYVYTLHMLSKFFLKL